MNRILRRVGALLAALSTGGCAVFASLPRPAGLQDRLAEFPVAGLPLSAPVEVHWNEHQVPWIEAQTDADAAFTLGLVHAHLRLGQIALARMLAQGRLAEMAGPMAVDIDHGLRTLDYGRAVPEIVAAMDPETLAWTQRFVDGINHYQDQARELPHEFRVLGIPRERWRVEDVLTIGRLGGTDVNWMVWAGLLPLRERADWPQLWQRMMAAGADPVPGADGSGLPGDSARALAGAARFGSNSLVVAPSMSATGAALIANDPHLGIFLPNFWLMAGLKSPSLHVVGLMAPGVPAFAIGRSPDIAWGGTHMRAASSDLVDVGGLPDSEIRSRRERIGVRWWFDDEVEIRETPYGPIVSDVPFLAERGLPPAALRWVGHQPSDELGAMLAASRARNFAEFLAAFRRFAAPGQNMLYADRDGNIGQLLAAHLPQRAGAPADLLLDPADSDPAWQGRHDATGLPHRLNPPEGYLASANNRPWTAAPPVGFFFAPGDRVERMGALVRAGAPVSPADLQDWQRDVYMQSAVDTRDALLPLLRAAPGAETGPGREVVRRLQAWDGQYRADSAGAASFELFRAGFAARFYADRYGEAHGAMVAAGGRLSAYLLEDLRRADPDAVAAALAAGLAAAVDGQAEFGHWGAMHRLALAHPLSVVPVIGNRYRFGEHPVGGSTETLMKTSHAWTTGRHNVTYGANARHVSDLGDPDGNHFVLLGGQDGWLNSSTLMDQWELWQEGRYIRMPLTESAIRAEFRHRLRLEPGPDSG